MNANCSISYSRLDAIASGGNPQDRNGAFSVLRIKFATGRTSASLLPVP
ncbi:MAG: hypothetical protein F6K55_08630 [Moorea sp. SIO4A3]|nr:hypothetical protein [Moorena sp. SIO4A3]